MIARDGFVMDCVRGYAWSEKYRGKIEDHPMLEVWRAKAAREETFPPNWIPPVKSNGWPSGRVGIGTFGWKYNPDVIHRAIEVGCSIIDTAEGYGFGRVETALGVVLKDYPERGFLVASKVSRNHLSAAATINAGNRSRDRLGIDTIDLYQIHWPHPGYPVEWTLQGMATLKERGVIDKIGLCNSSSVQLLHAMEVARSMGLEIESLQIRFNLNDKSAGEWLIGACKRLGVRVISYSPLDQGGLTAYVRSAIHYVTDAGTYAIPRTNNPDHVADWM